MICWFLFPFHTRTNCIIPGWLLGHFTTTFPPTLVSDKGLSLYTTPRVFLYRIKNNSLFFLCWTGLYNWRRLEQQALRLIAFQPREWRRRRENAKRNKDELLLLLLLHHHLDCYCVCVCVCGLVDWLCKAEWCRSTAAPTQGSQLYPARPINNCIYIHTSTSYSHL